MAETGKTLQEWMDDEGLDQAAVAGLLGCAQSTVSRVLNGQDPSGDFIRAAAKVSGGVVQPNTLFRDWRIAA